MIDIGKLLRSVDDLVTKSSHMPSINTTPAKTIHNQQEIGKPHLGQNPDPLNVFGPVMKKLLSNSVPGYSRMPTEMGKIRGAQGALQPFFRDIKNMKTTRDEEIAENIRNPINTSSGFFNRFNRVVLNKYGTSPGDPDLY